MIKTERCFHVLVFITLLVEILCNESTQLPYQQNGDIADSIQLYQNVEDDICLYGAADSPNYLLNGRFVFESGLRSVGFQKRMINSEKYEYDCIIHFSELFVESSHRPCYCKPTNVPNVYDIVLNTTLRVEDSIANVRAVMIFKDQNKKKISNELNLPRVYDLDDDDFHIEFQINDQPVKAEKCEQLIRSDTIKIQHISPLAYLHINIIDGNVITELRENMYQLKYSQQYVIPITIRVEACGKVLEKLDCTFYNVNRFGNKDNVFLVFLILMVVVQWLICIVYFVYTCTSIGRDLFKKI